MAVAIFMSPAAILGSRRNSPVVGPLTQLRYQQLIDADGGASINISLPAGGTPLVGYLLVKIRAAAATLTQINADPDIDGFPFNRMADSLATLNNTQKTAYRNRLLFLGYTAAEISAQLGADLGAKTMRDLVVFAAQRCVKPVAIDATHVDWSSAPVAQDSGVAVDFIDRVI